MMIRISFYTVNPVCMAAFFWLSMLAGSSCDDEGSKSESISSKSEATKSSSKDTTMDITFTNIKDAKGKVYVAVYNAESGFLNEDKALLREVFSVEKSGSLNVHLKIDKEGRYAVAAFHDLNGNGKLDKNMMGVPTEPYAFSNNARPKLRAPHWSEANFAWKPGAGAVSLKLEKW